jgi:hypothetical protein
MDTLSLGISYAFPGRILWFHGGDLREHRVEQQREKKYIRSMIADLKSDTASFSHVIRVHRRNWR